MENKSGKFRNFMHYYKWKILFLIALIAFAVLGITQCNISPEPLFSILCASESSNYNGDILMSELEANIDFEKTDEGKIKMYYEHVNIPESYADQTQLGTFEQIHTRMISGDCSLLLFDEETVYTYHDKEGVFVDITEYADKYNIPDENRYLSSNGFVCAVKVESNKFLESCSINTDGMYIAVRVPEDGNTKKYTNAKAAVEYILSNQ